MIFSDTKLPMNLRYFIRCLYSITIFIGCLLFTGTDAGVYFILLFGLGFLVKTGNISGNSVGMRAPQVYAEFGFWAYFIGTVINYLVIPGNINR